MSDKLDVGQFLRKFTDNLQGYVLDLAKISQMGDRQFEQFQKSVKRHFRTEVDAVNETLKSYIKEADSFIISDRPPFDNSK